MARQRKLEVVIAGDSKSYERTVARVERSSDRIGSSVSGMGSKFGGIASKLASVGKAAALGLAGAAVAAGAFAVSTIDSASNLAETQSKTSAVFGDSAAEILKWSDTSAKALGQSKQQALESASTFGNMFLQLGIGGDTAAGMSKQMVGLASDFASFHNADISDVLQAQTAAFRGEYDSVQRFVPTINAAAVEQKALALTGKATTKELTAQDKALATQALLMEGAGKAAGDFNRTSGGLANQQRILSARFEDVKAKIGTALLPIATKATAFFSDRMIPIFEKVGVGLKALFAAFSGEGVTSDGFVGTMERVGVVARNVVESVRQHWPQIKAIAEDVFERVSVVVGAVVEWIRAHWPEISSTITNVMNTVRTVIAGVVDFITTLWRNFGDNIWSYVQRVWPAIRAVIQGVLLTIRGIIKTITSLIKGDWSGVWNGIKQILAGVFGAILGLVRMAFEQMRLVIGIALEIIGSVIKGAWDRIKTVIGNAIGAVRDTLARGWFAIIGTIHAVWDGLTGFIGGAIDTIKGFFGGLWDSLGDGLVGVANWILSGIESLLNGIIGLINKALAAIDTAAGPWVNFGEIPRVSIGRIGGDSSSGATQPAGGRVFHSGGIVPGRPGTDVPIIAQAGERVLSRAQTHALDRSGVTAAPTVVHVALHVPIGAHGADVGRELIEYLRMYQDANGALPLKVTNA
jgi:hypothetical protein